MTETRVYAVADEVDPAYAKWFTAGKRYPVIWERKGWFGILDENGVEAPFVWAECVPQRSPGRIDWRRVVAPAPVDAESELDRLRAENAALREALSDLVGAARGMPFSRDNLCQGALDHAIENAEAALASGEPADG